MTLLTTEKKPNTYISLEENLSEKEIIGKLLDNVSYITLEKLQTEHENTDITSIQTNKLFSGDLYAHRGKEKSPHRQEIIDNDHLKPLGIEFTITKISQDVATIMMNRNPFIQIQKMRGLLLPEFPKENPIINESGKAAHLESTFKTNILVKD